MDENGKSNSFQLPGLTLGGAIFSQANTGIDQQVVRLYVWCHVTLSFGTQNIFFSETLIYKD